MEFSYEFIPVRQRDLDATQGDLLVASLFEEDRPPHGLTGLVDWRMDGLISRIRVRTIRPEATNPHYEGLALGPFHAGENEKLLFPAGEKLSHFTVMVLGLGSRRTYNSDRYKGAVATVLQAAASLGAERLTLQLPGWLDAGLPARRACDLFMTELVELRRRKPKVLKHVCFTEDLEHQAEMDEKIGEVRSAENRRRR